MFASPLRRPSTVSRAFGYLKQIVAIGPHTAGSAANTQVRKLVADHFTKTGAKVREQPFRAIHPQTGRSLGMANLIGSWQPDNLRRVVIGAHYDTRPHPDQEVLPNRHNLPFVGANDAASGVALLMEIANHLTDLDTHWGVDLVLFDGEELVFGNNCLEWANTSSARRSSRDLLRTRPGASALKCAMRPGLCSTWSAAATSDQAGAQQPGAAPQIGEPDLGGRCEFCASTRFAVEMGREVMDDHLAIDSRPASPRSI